MALIKCPECGQNISDQADTFFASARNLIE